MDFEICLQRQILEDQKEPRLTSEKSLPKTCIRIGLIEHIEDSWKRPWDLNGVNAELGERIYSKKC